MCSWIYYRVPVLVCYNVQGMPTNRTSRSDRPHTCDSYMYNIILIEWLRMRLWYRYTCLLFVCVILVALALFLLYRKDTEEKRPRRMRNWGPDAIFYNPYGNQSEHVKFPESRIKFSPNDEAHAQGQGDNAQWMSYLRKQHNINVYLSDFIPLNRAVPDSRPPG